MCFLKRHIPLGFLIFATLLDLIPLAEAAPRLKIGVITPLSGTLVASGQSVRDSLILADELYDTSDLVEFRVEDNGFQPKDSVTIARKFISDGVHAIIVFGTPTSFAVAPITEQAHVPLLAITIVDRVVADRKFTIRHFVSSQEETRRVIEEVKRRGYKSVAVVTSVNEASLALRDGFLTASPVEVVINEEFSKEDLDFRAIATKIKVRNPEAVYHLLFAPQGSIFVKTLRQLGYSGEIFAAHNVEDPSEIAASDGTYEGIWFVTGDDREGGEYFDAFKKRFKYYPAMGGPNAFDYGKMIIEAAIAKEPLLGRLKTLKDFRGAFGLYDANTKNSFDLKATVKVVKGSGFALP